MLFGRALKVVTFQDKVYDEIPYDRVRNDAASAIQSEKMPTWAKVTLGATTAAVYAPATAEVVSAYGSGVIMEYKICKSEFVVDAISSFFPATSPAPTFVGSFSYEINLIYGAISDK